MYNNNFIILILFISLNLNSSDNTKTNESSYFDLDQERFELHKEEHDDCNITFGSLDIVSPSQDISVHTDYDQEIIRVYDNKSGDITIFYYNSGFKGVRHKEIIPGAKKK